MSYVQLYRHSEGEMGIHIDKAWSWWHSLGEFSLQGREGICVQYTPYGYQLVYRA